MNTIAGHGTAAACPPPAPASGAKRQTGSTFRPASIHGLGAGPKRKAPIDWRALPDEQALAALEEAAAAHFGCHPDHVCAVPGTEIGLRLAADLLPATPPMACPAIAPMAR
jgi:histidinol-phosphate/aromatic aminotransferase/cobyric acid decarboxylase-like protein